MKLTKLVSEMKLVQVGRKRVGNMVVRTYIDANFNKFQFAEIVKVTKKEVVKEEVAKEVAVVSYIANEEVVTQETMVAEQVDEYELVVPRWMTKEYREAKKKTDELVEQIVKDMFAC